MALVAHYKFDEPDGSSTYADSVGGRNLTHSGTGTKVDPPPGVDGAIHILGGEELAAAEDPFWRTWARGDFTIAAWVHCYANDNASRGIVAVERNGSGETGHSLVQFFIGNQRHFIQWANPAATGGAGASASASLVSTLPWLTTENHGGAWVHVAVTRSGSTVEWFLGGVKFESDTMGQDQYSTDDTQTLRVGIRRSTATYSTTDTWDTNGFGLADLRLYDEVLTEEDLAIVAAAGPETNPPTITVVSPADGSTITPSTEFQVQLSDETELRHTAIWARFGVDDDFPKGRRPAELIWSGSAFERGYGSSSVTGDATSGYSLTIVRDGGWPMSPQLHGVAIDTAGNEAT